MWVQTTVLEKKCSRCMATHRSAIALPHDRSTGICVDHTDWGYSQDNIVLQDYAIIPEAIGIRAFRTNLEQALFFFGRIVHLHLEGKGLTTRTSFLEDDVFFPP